MSTGSDPLPDLSLLLPSWLLALNAAALVRFDGFVFMIILLSSAKLIFTNLQTEIFFYGIQNLSSNWISSSCWTDITGIHFVLFCICVFVLIRERRPAHSQWIILGSAFIMFALSTADVSLTIRLMTHDLVTTPDYMRGRIHPTNSIFVTNKYVP